MARTPEPARRMIDRGCGKLVFGFDWLLLQQAARRFLDDVRG